MILYPIHTDIASEGEPKQTDTKWAYILRNTPFPCELYLHSEMGMNY